MTISDDDWNAIRDIYESLGIPSDWFLGYPKMLLQFMALLKKRTGRDFRAEEVCKRLLHERKSGDLPKVGDPGDRGVLRKLDEIRRKVAGTIISCPMCNSEVTL